MCVGGLGRSLDREGFGRTAERGPLRGEVGRAGGD